MKAEGKVRTIFTGRVLSRKHADRLSRRFVIIVVRDDSVIGESHNAQVANDKQVARRKASNGKLVR